MWKWIKCRHQFRMQPSAIAFTVALWSSAALAVPEDGIVACTDGQDNDFDGKTDCFDLTCRSANPACPLWGSIPDRTG